MNAPEPFTPQEFSPLRIALLGYRSHPHVGGQGIYLKYLSKALVDLGHQVDVLSGPPYPELDPSVGLIKIPSLDLYASEQPLKELRWHHLTRFTDSYEYFSKLTGGFAEPYTFSLRVADYLSSRANHYDVIHDNQCLGYGLLHLQKMGLPVVATVHHPITRDLDIALSQQTRFGHKLLVRRWYRFLAMQTKVARKLDHLISVSEFSRQDISAAFGRPVDRIQVVANGIDTQVFRPLPTIKKSPYRIITTASSDQPLKGQKFLFQAIASLVDQHPDLELVIIGSLKENGDSQKLMEQLNLSQRVTFKSNLSTEALVEEYNRATVAVTPSLYEGFGLPAAEAMACGTAVVSSDGGALPEVVEEAGLIVPAGDAQALAEAINKVLINPCLSEQLGAFGRVHINKEFSWRKAAESYARYYLQMLNRRESPTCIPSTTSAFN